MRRWIAAATLALVLLWIAGCIGGATPTPESRTTPPAIPHTLVARSDCLLCHISGIAAAPAMPDYHLGLDNQVCTVCHKTASEASPTPTPTPLPGATLSPTQPSPSPTHTLLPEPAPAVAAPRIPHALEGRGECLACHDSPVQSIPQVPPDHAGRTNDTCILCHSGPAATQ